MTAIVKKALIYLDQRFEPFFMVLTYMGFSLIISVEVVRRFIFKEQTTWGAEVAIHLFIWLTWFATAWAVKKGTHLSFPAIRGRLPRRFQLFLNILDSLLWFLLGIVVLYGAKSMIEMQYMFGSVIQGSSIPLWWSFSIVPLGWFLIYVRVIQRTIHTICAYRRGESLSGVQGLR